MTEMEREALIAEMKSLYWWHSIPLPSLGVTTPGHELNPEIRDAYMHIPWDQMKGKTVLDIGAWSGKYSFLAEQAGAAVVIAGDRYTAQDGPSVDPIMFARKALKSSVAILFCNIENEPDGQRECVDFALFLGVLYHLKNPFRALEGIGEIIAPGGLLVLETALTPVQPEGPPILELCEGSRDGDQHNWNYPNRAWVEAALRVTGFRDIEYKGGVGNRGAWHARAK